MPPLFLADSQQNKGFSAVAAPKVSVAVRNVWDMIDVDPVEGLDRAAAARAVADGHRFIVAEETQLFRLAAHWADLHHPDAKIIDGYVLPGTERAKRYGGAGTPAVSEFAPAEFGALQEMTTSAAVAMIADALDVRHRLPRLWRLVVSGGVRVWKARKVAVQTRHLSPEACDQVDADIDGYVNAMSWGRFLNLLRAKIINADPIEAEKSRRHAEADRFVKAGRVDEHGLQTLIARARAGDVRWFNATIERIAEILEIEGDHHPLDVRRSKAIGILAQPAIALDLLVRHATPDNDADDDQDSADDSPVSGGEAGPEGPPSNGPPDSGSRTTGPPGGAGLVLPQEFSLDGVDLKKLRPDVVLYLHLDAATFLQLTIEAGRFEGVGPITSSQIRAFCGGDAHVTIKPVLDLDGVKPVDGYAWPTKTREALHLRTPFDVVPYGTSDSRRMQIDHSTAYTPITDGGRTGQTSTANGGPMTTYHHRVKTHADRQHCQPRPGTYFWRSPTGRVHLVDHNGTHDLGHDQLAQALFTAADQHTRRASDDWIRWAVTTKRQTPADSSSPAPPMPQSDGARPVGPIPGWSNSRRPLRRTDLVRRHRRISTVHGTRDHITAVAGAVTLEATGHVPTGETPSAVTS